MRIMVVCAVALLAAPISAIENTEANRLEQAERYLTATPPSEMVNDMAVNMSKNMPTEKATDFVAVMTKGVDLGVLRKSMLDAMVKHFTADELKALADFYGSPVGKSAMQKFGPYMQDVMPKIQQEVMKAFADFMEPTKAK